MRKLFMGVICLVILLAGCSNPTGETSTVIEGIVGDLAYHSSDMRYWVLDLPTGDSSDYHISVYVLAEYGWVRPFWRPEGAFLRIYDTDEVDETTQYRVLLIKAK